MKNQNKIFAAGFLMVFLISVAACDKIDGPTREEHTGTVDTSCSFTTDNTPAVKKVLFEDYTGYLCGNCPAGAIYLNDTMAPPYGDRLIIMSVHAGFFAVPCGQPGGACPGTQPAGAFTTDFRNPAGEDWYTTFGVFNNPLGIVDRAGFGTGSFLVNKPQWNTKVAAEMALAPEVRLRMQNTYDPSTRKVRTCIESKFLQAMNDTFSLEVVLIEDSVIDWQLWYNHSPEFVQNYVHRHVLRTAINGSFGSTLVEGNIQADSTIVTGYNFNLDPAWNAEHCYVISFVFDKNNYRVLQVEEAKVTN